MKSGRFRILAVLLIALPASNAAAATPATWRKLQLSDRFFCEGAAFGDLNRDGHLDAIAGPYWYEGPGFIARHELYPPVVFDPLKYSDNFIVAAHDFNADGWADVMVVGFPNKDTHWYQNPGDTGGTWRKHHALELTANESPMFGTLIGQAQPVLLCLHRGRVGYASPNAKEPAGLWSFHPITPPAQWQRFGHAIGFGDINGDGRPDVLGKDGWWEQPVSLDGDPVWTHRPATFTASRGGAQMHAYDVNGDGLTDVITSHDAHGFGLSWLEQVRSADGVISFRDHPILSPRADTKVAGIQFSQLHAVGFADLDADGLPDIVTGKRWWAHGPKGDPDPNGTPVLYGFLLRRGPGNTVSFEPRLIDDASGVGTQIATADVNGDGRADILSANKRGTFLFLSQTPLLSP